MPSDTALFGAIVSVDEAMVMLGASLGLVSIEDACWPNADEPFCANAPKPFEAPAKPPNPPELAADVVVAGDAAVLNADLPKAD